MLDDTRLTLTEGSVVERIARSHADLLDASIGYAGLLASGEGRAALLDIWREYVTAAAPFPVVLHTPTFRCSRSRMARSSMSEYAIEREAVALMRTAVDDLTCSSRCSVERAPSSAVTSKTANNAASPRACDVLVAGLLGPLGDCYTPDEAPSRDDAAREHCWQIERLVDAQCDFVLAATLPAAREAHGIADAMRDIDVPYVLSVVVRCDATLLDGTALVDLIRTVDASAHAPRVYWVNCTHPLAFGAALRVAYAQDSSAARRVRGFQANTSPRDPSEYDAIDAVETIEPDEFARSLHALRNEFALNVLGGCCGTRAAHIRALAMASR